VKITLYYTGFKKTVCIVTAECSSLKRKNRSTFLSVITASNVNLGWNFCAKCNPSKHVSGKDLFYLFPYS
jgi:protein involved in ribonucleotide reduction